MADDDLPPLGVMELLPVVLMLLGLSLPWALGAYMDGKMCADVPAIAFAPHRWFVQAFWLQFCMVAAVWGTVSRRAQEEPLVRAPGAMSETQRYPLP
jgi:hypothetical protein